MNRILLFFVLIFAFQSASAQLLERRYMEYQNLNRTYLIYVPSTYDPNSSEEVPIVFAFHGINATDENLVGVRLNDFAERENFIVVYPQASQVELGIIAWNCGVIIGTQVDDAGWWNALLDQLMEQYSIDYKRVYLCGFSMGGMMANRLACEYGDRIAAHASVSGPLTNTIYSNCEPVRKMPYMHFHGLSDQTVAYFGNGLIGVKGAMATVQWWANRNGCDIDFQTEAVPDTADEYYHVDRLNFPSCSGDYEVIHYRIENWPHSWPGPSRNVFATAEIVDFFMRHELEEQDIVLTPVVEDEWNSFKPAPNPFHDRLDLRQAGLQIEDLQWSIFNSGGQEVIRGNDPILINTVNWPTGIYFLRMQDGKESTTFKLVKE